MSGAEARLTHFSNVEEGGSSKHQATMKSITFLALAFFAVLVVSQPYAATPDTNSPSSCKSDGAPHGVICKKSDHDEEEDESKDFDLWKEMRITGAPDEHDPWVGTGPPHEVKCVEGNCYK
ncbi:hypothetical protein LTR57_002516 [Friedmanniomyces endolithicus]|nr:hypothetical protein LTR57_002516 [Friedmanniomyces endolithicus]